MGENEFHSKALQFLEELFLDIAKHQIEISEAWQIDHLCYRVDTIEHYEEMKKEFSSFGSLLIESPVNGRAIATYKLHQPIHFKSWSIGVVELPAPKKIKPTPTGFEHIEVVCDISFQELEQKYRHLDLDLSGLAKALNQEFEIRLGPQKSLKFHHQSLESVIQQEMNEKL